MPRLLLTVLGSGGPIANPRRVSAGYLVSLDGKVRFLVGAGGGTYERIGQSGADLSTLEQILITHMHIDHTSDVPAVIMDIYMRKRGRSIAIAGPAGRPGNDAAPENASPQPGAIEFIRLLFGPDGAWRYMNTFDGFGTIVRETPSNVADASIHNVPLDDTLNRLGVSVHSTAVPHGMMPSVAFRIACGDESIVITGDVSTSTPALIALAKNCSILVHDAALPERDVPHGKLHAKPSAIGHTARESGARMLVLSHFMPAIENEIGDAVAIIRREYTGPIEVAHDLATYQPVA